MRLVEQGLLTLDSTVAEWFPDEFGSGEKASITIRMLLTHTAGFPSGPSHWLFTYPTLEERRAAIVQHRLHAILQRDEPARRAMTCAVWRRGYR